MSLISQNNKHTIRVFGSTYTLPTLNHLFTTAIIQVGKYHVLHIKGITFVHDIFIYIVRHISGKAAAMYIIEYMMGSIIVKSTDEYIDLQVLINEYNRHITGLRSILDTVTPMIVILQYALADSLMDRDRVHETLLSDTTTDLFLDSHYINK